MKKINAKILSGLSTIIVMIMLITPASVYSQSMGSGNWQYYSTESSGTGGCNRSVSGSDPSNIQLKVSCDGTKDANAYALVKYTSYLKSIPEGYKPEAKLSWHLDGRLLKWDTNAQAYLQFTYTLKTSSGGVIGYGYYQYEASYAWMITEYKQWVYHTITANNYLSSNTDVKLEVEIVAYVYESNYVDFKDNNRKITFGYLNWYGILPSGGGGGGGGGTCSTQCLTP
jgi:hypothetical protein